MKQPTPYEFPLIFGLEVIVLLSLLALFGLLSACGGPPSVRSGRTTYYAENGQCAWADGQWLDYWAFYGHQDYIPRDDELSPTPDQWAASTVEAVCEVTVVPPPVVPPPVVPPPVVPPPVVPPPVGCGPVRVTHGGRCHKLNPLQCESGGRHQGWTVEPCGSERDDD